jgi:hypothetical protein
MFNNADERDVSSLGVCKPGYAYSVITVLLRSAVKAGKQGLVTFILLKSFSKNLKNPSL